MEYESEYEHKPLVPSVEAWAHESIAPKARGRMVLKSKVVPGLGFQFMQFPSGKKQITPRMWMSAIDLYLVTLG